MNNRQLTTEEANVVLSEAVGASVERDVAIDAAAQALANEAVAKETARAQGVAARGAEAKAATMDTLRHVANARADQESRDADTSRFGFYLLAGIFLVALIMVVIWLATRSPETKVSSPIAPAPGQSIQAPQTPPTAPPQTVVIPGPQGPQGPAGPAARQGATGASGTPGPSGPSGAPGPAGPSGASGATAPAATTPPSGQ